MPVWREENACCSRIRTIRFSTLADYCLWASRFLEHGERTCRVSPSRDMAMMGRGPRTGVQQTPFAHGPRRLRLSAASDPSIDAGVAINGISGSVRPRSHQDHHPGRILLSFTQEGRHEAPSQPILPGTPFAHVLWPGTSFAKASTDKAGSTACRRSASSAGISGTPVTGRDAETDEPENC